jgi:hypothetical protein
LVVSELPIRRCWRARKIGVEFEGLRWIVYSLIEPQEEKKEGKKGGFS